MRPVEPPRPRFRADERFRRRCGDNLARFARLAEPVRPGDRRSAVVACIVADTAGEACLLVTQRAHALRAHPGQFALPGGRLDSGEGAVGAALREMREEVGVECGTADVLGVLDDYRTRSGYVITPVVTWGPPVVRLTPNPDEVAAVHLAPVADLDREGAPRLIEIAESDRPVIQMPMIGNWIHAPTAAVLYQFREVVLHGRSTRVAHFEQPTWAWR